MFKQIKKTTNMAFTLVEVLVATALFAIVMVVSIGALLSLIDANKKAQAMQSVMNNLNIAIDGMARAIRMGSDYHCGIGNLSTPTDCVATAGDQIAFEAFGGDRNDPNDQWVYWVAEDPNFNNIHRIFRSKHSKQTPIAITAPEVDITSFEVYVTGTNRTDTLQPLVVLSIKGVAGSKITSSFSPFGVRKRIETKFEIQTSASQRLLDI